MKLPLTIDRICSCWAIIYDATGARICALDSDNAAEDATAIVSAVNERAADKAEIARLREALLTSETMALYVVDMAGGFNDVELQVVPLRRLKAIADYAHAALDAKEVTG